MTELEKKKLRLPFCFDDPEVDALKLHAAKGCQKLESIDVPDNTLVAGVPAKPVKTLECDV